MPSPGTPSPEQLRILLARAQRDGLDVSIIHRLSVILHFAEHRYSISETCRQFGISRSTFHRWIERFDPEDLSSLADKSHEPLTSRQSAISAEAIDLIRRYRMRYPQMGKERLAELLLLDHSVTLSPSSIARIIESECLYFADTPFHWKKRLGKKASVPCGGEMMITEYEQSSVSQSDHEQRHITIKPVSDEKSTDSVPVFPSLQWNTVKRFLIVSSVITNLFFVSLLLGSALFERFSTPEPSSVQTETLHAAPALHYIP